MTVLPFVDGVDSLDDLLGSSTGIEANDIHLIRRAAAGTAPPHGVGSQNVSVRRAGDVPVVIAVELPAVGAILVEQQNCRADPAVGVADRADPVRQPCRHFVADALQKFAAVEVAQMAVQTLPSPAWPVDPVDPVEDGPGRSFVGVHDVFRIGEELEMICHKISEVIPSDQPEIRQFENQHFRAGGAETRRPVKRNGATAIP